MKVLTLWQPWATLIALGVKVHETRSWSTPYRGPLAIHAAKRPICRAGRQVIDYLTIHHHLEFSIPLEFDFGCIVATANLVDMYPTDEVETTDPDWASGDFTAGRFAWWLDDVRRCSVPHKGAQGLRNLPADVEAQVLAQIRGGSHD